LGYNAAAHLSAAAGEVAAWLPIERAEVGRSRIDEHEGSEEGIGVISLV
jgi:hypothetical protein